FPIAWVSRFLPQIRFESGRLYGDFRARVSEDREVLIDSASPFEIRDARIFWQDIPLAREGRLELRPSIRINSREIRTSLDGIQIRGARGGRANGTVNLRAVPERRGKVDVDASLIVAAPYFTDPIGRLGEFRLEADATLEPAHRMLTVSRAAFDCR